MWKAIEAVAIAVGALGLLTGIGLEFQHGGFPREPNPAAGRIVPENYHGVYVFLTREEASFENLCLSIGTVAAIIGVAVDVYRDPYRRRGKGRG